MGKKVLVIAAGERSEVRPSPEEHFDLVIAADGGLDYAQSLGIKVDAVVGDLDSASSEALDAIRAAGVEIEGHPAEKDHTDLELALERAISEHPDQIRVLGASGGRPDHWLTNLCLLAAAAQRGPRVEADIDGWTATVVVPGTPYAAAAATGEPVSLVPIGGDARGVATEGLTYELRAEDLAWSGSRGISNVASGEKVRVEVESGALLLFRPSPVNATPIPEGAVR